MSRGRRSAARATGAYPRAASPTQALESDAEASRERIAQLLGELRGHMTSGALAGEAVRIAIGVAVGVLLTSTARQLRAPPPRTSPAVDDGADDPVADEADRVESAVRRTYDTVRQLIADMPIGRYSGRRRAPSGPGLLAPPYGK